MALSSGQLLIALEKGLSAGRHGRTCEILRFTRPDDSRVYGRAVHATSTVAVTREGDQIGAVGSAFSCISVAGPPDSATSSLLTFRGATVAPGLTPQVLEGNNHLTLFGKEALSLPKEVD